MRFHFVETYAIKFTEWCWSSRVKLLKRKGERNEDKQYFKH